MSDPQQFRFSRHKVRVPPQISYKWSVAVMEEGFVPFPKRFLRCLSQLVGDVRDLQVIMAIADYARPDLTRPASLDRLAFAAGLPVDEFRERVTEKVRHGWFSVSGTPDAITIGMDGLMRLVEKATPEEVPPFEGTNTSVNY